MQYLQFQLEMLSSSYRFNVQLYIKHFEFQLNSCYLPVAYIQCRSCWYSLAVAVGLVAILCLQLEYIAFCGRAHLAQILSTPFVGSFKLSAVQVSSWLISSLLASGLNCIMCRWLESLTKADQGWTYKQAAQLSPIFYVKQLVAKQQVYKQPDK